MSDSYCCVRFAELVSRGSERGLAIVPKRHPRFGNAFYLQFRATAEEHDELLLETKEIPVTRSVEQAIEYCPWCGARLAGVYAETFDLLPYVDDKTKP